MQLKPRVLDRFILGEISGPFIFGILIFTMIFVAGDLMFQAAKLIIEKGVPFSVVMRLFMYRLPDVISLTLPMACLLATLLGMTRLASNSELIAFKSLGISFSRILRPIIAASLTISAIALVFYETVVPITTQAAENLTKYEIMKNQPSILEEKVFLRDEQDGNLNRVLYIDQIDTKNGLMKDVMVQEFGNGALIRTSLAKSGVWKDGEWWIEDGQVFEVSPKGVVRLLFRFDRQKLMLNLSPKQLQRSSRRPVDMSAHELLEYIHQVQAVGSSAKADGSSLSNSASVSKLWVLFHLRLAIPWACVIMALLGASFGAAVHARSGTSVGFGISVVFVFAYYVMMSMCRALGDSGKMAPILAAWTPNLVFLVIGFFLSRRVD